MSLFQDDSSQIKTAIVYFNSLPSQQKALVVSDLNSVQGNKVLIAKLGSDIGCNSK